MKSLFIIITIFLIGTINSSEIIDELKYQLKSIPMPSNYQSLIKDLNGCALADISYIHVNEYSQKIKQFNFPNTILSKFNNIIWSSSIKFQSFQLTIKHTEYGLTEFYGVGRNYKGLITIAFINATASSLTTNPPLPDCSKLKDNFFFPMKTMCEKSRKIQIAKQALTPAKIKIIEQALTSYANKLALEKLNNPPSSFSDYQKQQDQYNKQVDLNQSLERYSGKNCSQVAPSCTGQTVANNCYYMKPCKGDNLFGYFFCQERIKQCQTFVKQQPKTSECFKCICLNTKLEEKQNLLQCF